LLGAIERVVYADGDGNNVHSAYERWSANASLLWTPGAQTYVELAAARSNGEAAYADRAMDGVKFDRTNYALRLRRDNLTPLITSVEARAFHNYVDHVMDNHTLRDFMPTMSMANPSANNPDRQTIGGLAQITLALDGGADATAGNAEFSSGQNAKKNLGAPRDASSLTITAGVDTQGNKHTLRSTTNEPTMPYEAMSRMKDARFTQYGIFAEATWTPAPARRLIAGARLDHWNATDHRQTRAIAMTDMPNPTANQTRRENLTSGFIRYEHDLTCCNHHGNDCACKTPLTLFAGIGLVQRFPDYWELFPNESTTTITAFNTTKPETTAQADLGALWHSGPVDVSVSLFVSRITDYILVQSNHAKPAGMAGTRAATITRNIDARTLGGEATLTWRITEHWKADATAAHVLGENDTDSQPLAQIPPIEARIALAYATNNWSVGGLFRAVSVQKRVAINQGNIAGQDIGPSAGFATAALNASHRFGKHIRLSAGVDNLFDKTHAEHISRAGSMIPGFVQTRQLNEPGRTFWAKLDATF
jgi:iron complex outermembrane receptor protein